MNNPTDACKQHCALLMADSVETEELLIKTYGLTGTTKIPVPVNSTWDRANRHEQAHDIYVIRLDAADLDWLRRCGVGSTGAATAEIYKRYYGKRNIDIEFDIVVMGTPDFIAKLKHRGTDTTADFQVRE